MCCVYSSSVCSLGLSRLPASSWPPVACSLSVLSRGIILYFQYYPPKETSMFFSNLLDKEKTGEAQWLVCVQAADAPVCFFNAHFDHVQVTFTVCWHWLPRQAIHIFITEKKKKKMVLRLRRRWGDSKRGRQWQQLWRWLSLLIKWRRGKNAGNGLTFLGNPRAWSLSYCAKPICTRQ